MVEGGAREDTWAGRGLLKKQLHVGCTATLKGLSVQRNGQSCVVEAFIRETGKWRVRLQGSGLRKELKPDHLILESHAEVAPPYDPALEGPRAGATAAPERRAPEAFRPGAEERPRPTLAPGRRVTLQGLKSAVELNGRGGVLEALVPESGRWRVSLDGGQVKDLKPDNLVPQEEAPAPPDAPESVLREAAALEADLDRGARWEATPGDTCGPGGRFVIEEMLGEGVFSTVFRCRDSRVSGMAYAVKFTRSSERTRKGLEREIRIMGFLSKSAAELDPEGLRCIIGLAFFEGFEYRGRLAVAFELMKCNVREALSKYGAGKGLPLLPTARNFGRSVFLALRALRRAGILHTDVKPENLLLSRDNESVKLCDFGTAIAMSERFITEEMTPRNYRAPEIMLGQEYSTQIDVWSAACTLFQMCTDSFLFEQETNNEMLHDMLNVVGPFPTTFSTSGKFALNHFHANGDFLNSKGDMVMHSENPRVCPMARFEQPRRPLGQLLEDALRDPPKGVPSERFEGLKLHLLDLLNRCLCVVPENRATPEAALSHKFFQKGAG